MKSMNNIDRAKIAEYLQKADTNYRLHDPGRYLYVEFCEREDYLSDEYIELLYVVLVAWGMNSRGASLSELNVFRESILSNKQRIESLRDERLELIDLATIRTQASVLFEQLDLIGKGNSRFVTYSKTLHLLLPNLFVPMDRKYTLSFYSKYIPLGVSKQFDKYWNIMLDMASFANNNLHVLQQGIRSEGRTWNQNIPKTIDNILIGKKI